MKDVLRLHLAHCAKILIMGAMLADILLILHFLYILAVLLPVPMILLGAIRGWAFTRNFWFRTLHLGAVGFLIVQTIVGFTCPLTDWEVNLRSASGQAVYEESFVEHWVGRLVFYDVSAALLGALYLLFGLTVILLYVFYPPRWIRLSP